MDTLPVGAPIVNPTTVTNPSNSWPSWTGEERWEPGPINLEDSGSHGDGGRPRLAMAGWIEARAGTLWLIGSDLADWLARKLDGIASECRFLDTETPDEFDARAEVWADWVRDDEPRDGEGGGL